MPDAEMIKPYVEQKIGEMLGRDRLDYDEDGDIPIRHGSSVSFVRLFDGPAGPILRVFSPLLGELKVSRKLLARVNELNAGSTLLRFFFAQGTIFCVVDLPAQDLQPGELQQAVSAVAGTADRLDDLLKDDFGGRRMIEEDDAVKPGHGAYL